MEIKILKTIKKFFSKKQEKEKVGTKFYTKDFFIDKKYIIGDYTYGKPAVIFESNETNLFIGKFCSFASGVTIFLGGNHRPDWISTYPFNSIPNSDFEAYNYIEGHPASKGNVVIGNDVWIGLNTTILSGISIGDGAIIGAESLVTKNVGPYEIWGGNPAKFIKKRFDDDTIQKLLEIKWWDWDIEKIKQNIPILMNINTEDLIIKFD